MLRRNNTSASFFALSSIATLSVVRILLLNPILLNKHWAQEDESKSRWARLSFRLRSINAFATDIAIAEETNPQVLRREIKSLWTMWSRFPRSNGLPWGNVFILLLTSRNSFRAVAISSFYALANRLAVLSFNGLSFEQNLLSAALKSCTTA